MTRCLIGQYLHHLMGVAIQTRGARKFACPTRFGHTFTETSSSGGGTVQPNVCARHHIHKQILFVRHGLTEMNERLQAMPWYSDNFVDAALWDTRLSDVGKQQAKDAHQLLLNGGKNQYMIDRMQVILSSPLTRALHTAEIVFGHVENVLPQGIPQVVHPLLRERLYLSSEVGRSKQELRSEFSAWDFTHLPEDRPWWYVHNRGLTIAQGDGIAQEDGSSCTTSCSSNFAAAQLTPRTVPSITLSESYNQGAVNPQGAGARYSHENVHFITEDHPQSLNPYIEWRPKGKYCCEGEPRTVFIERILQLKQYLLNRPEEYIVVVAHWGVIKALTGEEFENCEMKLVKAADLLEEPFASDE